MNKSQDIGDLLIQLGIYPNVKGFDYYIAATEIINTSAKSLNTVEIYSRIAERYDTTYTRVERAMRHATEMLFNNNNGEKNTLLYDIVGQNYSFTKSKPTNGQFMYSLARYCKKYDIASASAPDEQSIDTLRIQYLDKLLMREFPEYAEVLKHASTH